MVVASLDYSSYLLISLIDAMVFAIYVFEVSYLGLVTLDLSPAAAYPNLHVWYASPEFLSAVERQRINEEKAVPSKQDFIIFVIVESFQFTSMGYL